MGTRRSLTGKEAENGILRPREEQKLVGQKGPRFEDKSGGDFRVADAVTGRESCFGSWLAGRRATGSGRADRPRRALWELNNVKGQHVAAGTSSSAAKGKEEGRARGQRRNDSYLQRATERLHTLETAVERVQSPQEGSAAVLSRARESTNEDRPGMQAAGG